MTRKCLEDFQRDDIADNRRLAQQPMCLDTAPQRAFGGNISALY